MELYHKTQNQSRSISAENKSGEKNNGARSTTGVGYKASVNYGVGWKVSPCIKIAANTRVNIAEIDGPGIIKSMWFTHDLSSRNFIIRIFWDGKSEPSVEAPLGDFFFKANGEFFPINSRYINLNPGRGYNSFWEMPFNKKCRIEIENIGKKEAHFFYQINYELCEEMKDILYFHTFFKREDILDTPGICGIIPKINCGGKYVATYLNWQVNKNLWWGEGEIKFYLDGDEYPTICGTGTEDYFGGAWNFENPRTKQYHDYSALYFGFYQDEMDDTYKCNKRFNMYRIHKNDPILFTKDLRVEIQALGWNSDFSHYLKLRDDISSLAVLYLDKIVDVTNKNISYEYLEIV